jgi:hypothetical protein
LFQFGKDFIASLIIQLLHALAAVGGDDADFFAVRLQQPRHEGAAARFKMFQHADFIIETLQRIGGMISLHDPAIKREMDGGPKRVFDLYHAVKSPRDFTPIIAHPADDAKRIAIRFAQRG